MKDGSPEHVSRVSGEIAMLRSEIGSLVGELDRRRHELFDLRLQARRHPVGLAIVQDVYPSPPAPIPAKLGAFFTKMLVLITRAIFDMFSRSVDHMVAVWPKPCSTRLAIAIASSTSRARTRPTRGINNSCCTKGCDSSTSAKSKRNSSGALLPIARRIALACLPTKSRFT